MQPVRDVLSSASVVIQENVERPMPEARELVMPSESGSEPLPEQLLPNTKKVGEAMSTSLTIIIKKVHFRDKGVYSLKTHIGLEMLFKAHYLWMVMRAGLFAQMKHSMFCISSRNFWCSSSHCHSRKRDVHFLLQSYSHCHIDAWIVDVRSNLKWQLTGVWAYLKGHDKSRYRIWFVIYNVLNVVNGCIWKILMR